MLDIAVVLGKLRLQNATAFLCPLHFYGNLDKRVAAAEYGYLP